MTVHLNRDAGFTLLEVLIALVLTGLVVSAGLGLPKLFARFDQQSQTVAELRDGVAAAGRLLRALTEGAAPDLSSTEEPVQASETVLMLNSLGPPILAFDRPTPLTLRIIAEDGHAALRLAWADPETGAAREETVLAGARSIRLSYFNPGRSGAGGGWRPDWARRWALPAAILLRVDAPELGPPIDLIAHTRARLPEACLLLPQEPACRPG
jgi:prepilin-type N-terminal cleavage/methylation domain-containing protein